MQTQTLRISFRASPELIAAANREAKANERTLSQQIRYALAASIAKQEKEPKPKQ